MPKLACKCGYIHNLSPIPDEGYSTIPDKYLEKIIDDEDHDVRDGTYSKYGRLFYECPDCKRIMWDKNGNALGSTTGKFVIIR